MVTDSLVGDVLLASILGDAEPTEFGLVVDGFPRTSLQVDFLKLLHDKLEALHDTHADDEGPDGCARFPRPSFKVVMLYVDEETSISRQLRRAKIASLHNRRARDAGAWRRPPIAPLPPPACWLAPSVFTTPRSPPPPPPPPPPPFWPQARACSSRSGRPMCRWRPPTSATRSSKPTTPPSCASSRRVRAAALPHPLFFSALAPPLALGPPPLTAAAPLWLVRSPPTPASLPSPPTPWRAVLPLPPHRLHGHADGDAGADHAGGAFWRLLRACTPRSLALTARFALARCSCGKPR